MRDSSFPPELLAASSSSPRARLSTNTKKVGPVHSRNGHGRRQTKPQENSLAMWPILKSGRHTAAIVSLLVKARHVRSCARLVSFPRRAETGIVRAGFSRGRRTLYNPNGRTTSGMHLPLSSVATLCGLVAPEPTGILHAELGAPSSARNTFSFIIPRSFSLYSIRAEPTLAWRVGDVARPLHTPSIKAQREPPPRA